MITSDQSVRMSLSSAMEGGDLSCRGLGAEPGDEGTWAKIIEGAPGEPAAERVTRVRSRRLSGSPKRRQCVCRSRDDEWPTGLDDLSHAESMQRRGGEPFGLC